MPRLGRQYKKIRDLVGTSGSGAPPARAPLPSIHASGSAARGPEAKARFRTRGGASLGEWWQHRSSGVNLIIVIILAGHPIREKISQALQRLPGNGMASLERQELHRKAALAQEIAQPLPPPEPHRPSPL